MLKILNETVKKNYKDIEAMYPRCKFILALEEPLDNEGFLIAVSNSSDNFKDLIELNQKLDENSTLFHTVAGTYNPDYIRTQFEFKEV